MDNYEQKYKNALSWMQSLYKGLHGKTKEEAETYFPELAESEDERIRKALIIAINNICNGDEGLVTFNGFPKEQVLAWLEKQAQKPAGKVAPKFKVGQTIKKEYFNLGFTIVKIEDGFYYNNMGDYFPFTDQDNWELVEQKPAWSEEDERMYRGLHNLIYSTPYCDSRKEFSDWLRGIKDRVQPQPRQEWSEEDIVAIDCAVEVLSKDLPSLAASIERLKSLRPQNRWKPSNEQMMQLGWIAKQNAHNILGKELVSLYQDLKKLREE